MKRKICKHDNYFTDNLQNVIKSIWIQDVKDDLRKSCEASMTFGVKTVLQTNSSYSYIVNGLFKIIEANSLYQREHFSGKKTDL